MTRGVALRSTSWAELVDEAVGRVGTGRFDSVWLMSRGQDPAVTAPALVEVLSQQPSSVRVGVDVALLVDRPAVLAAKQLATMDVICGGTLLLLVDGESQRRIVEIAAGDEFAPSLSAAHEGRIWRTLPRNAFDPSRNNLQVVTDEPDETAQFSFIWTP